MINSQLAAVCFMILSMVSYQISASFAKQMMLMLDPITVVTLRLCFAAILVFFMFRSWRIIKQLPQLQWRDLLFYSGSVGLMNLLFYLSLDRLPQGIAVGLEFLGPLTLALLSIQRRSDYLWVGLAILGIALMVPWQQTSQSNFSYMGAAMALGAGGFWTIYIYYGQRVARQNIGLHALTIAITFSALLLLPVSIIHNPHALIQTEYWGYALVIALLATAIPYSLDLLALKRLSKLSYGTLTSLSLAIAAVAGMLILNERITGLQSLALLCIMLASVGVSLSSAKAQRRETS